MTAKIMTIEDLLKSCHIRQLDEQQKIVDAVADLRLENRVLVEALKEYAEGFGSKKLAKQALKKTGHWE